MEIKLKKFFLGSVIIYLLSPAYGMESKERKDNQPNINNLNTFTHYITSLSSLEHNMKIQFPEIEKMKASEQANKTIEGLKRQVEEAEKKAQTAQAAEIEKTKALEEANQTIETLKKQVEEAKISAQTVQATAVV